jgi:hypothetical protein
MSDIPHITNIITDKFKELKYSNLVLISRGESIITAKATKQYKGLSISMNKGKMGEWKNKNYGGEY